MPNRYLLTEKMREELLETFKAAQDMALKTHDIVSAEYYQMMVKHLVNMKAVIKKDFVSEKKEESKNILPRMSLKELEIWLRSDREMSADDKFELYYEERELFKGKKNKNTLNKMLKDLGIYLPKKSR